MATTSIRGGFGMAWDTLYDNIGILAVPPQVGSTAQAVPLSPDFLANGGLKGTGGTGVTTLTRTEALDATANWIPPNVKDPYSVNWNFRYPTLLWQELHCRGQLRRYCRPCPELPGHPHLAGFRHTDEFPAHLLAGSQPSHIERASLSLGSDLLGFPIVGNVDPIVPAYAQAGFGCTFNGPTSPTSPFCPVSQISNHSRSITAFIPAGWSKYNGLDDGAYPANEQRANGQGRLHLESHH